jgi:protein-arginine deiminase
MGDNNKKNEEESLFFYIRNGDRRVFNPGFSKGYIKLKSADRVRVVAIRKDNGQQMELRIGKKISLFSILADSLLMIPLSEQKGKFTLQNFDHSNTRVNQIHYTTIGFPIYLDCDADRDGIVGFNEEGKANWSWGPEGRGAVLLVNNDKDKSGPLCPPDSKSADSKSSDPESPHSPGAEYSELLVRSTGFNYDTLKELGVELRLYATPRAAKRFTVYRVDKNENLVFILGAMHDKGEPKVKPISDPLDPEGERLLVEAHQYPGQYSEKYSTCLRKCLDKCLEKCLEKKLEKYPEACIKKCREDYPDSNFEGLISIELHLRKIEEGIPEGILLKSDRVVFRVAPWIMTPNTLPVKKVYVSQVDNDQAENKKFIEDLQKECDRLNVTLDPVSQDENRGDAFIQDQIEFGYSQGTRHHLDVVFDSPRKEDIGTHEFPERVLKDKNVGHFELGGKSEEKNALDSFGNLEVSPPVTVNGKHYPLGRIIFGGRSYINLTPKPREMMPKIRRFLYAQKVQSPIEVFTDWLEVGHVDEIICFIPNTSPTPPGEKEFKVLLASPACAYTLLKTLERCHGTNAVFYGKKDREEKSAQTTVIDILKIDNLLEGTMVFQEYMNLNRAILAKHLGLQHNDFIDIPVLFEVEFKKKAKEGTEKEVRHLQRTKAYFPNMINHLVIGHTSIVPKPYGPKINNQYDCAFEEAFCKAMPRGHEVRFIDAWDPYHTKRAAIHCGTNTLRELPTDIKWWHTLPDEGFDI